MFNYNIVSRITSAVCVTLFFLLLLYPALIFWLFQVPGNEAASFMLRRAAMLFLGLAVIAWFSRDSEHSSSRQSICLGMALGMFGLAVLGVCEYFLKNVGVGVFLAVIAEFTIGLCYVGIWHKSKNA